MKQTERAVFGPYHHPLAGLIRENRITEEQNMRQSLQTNTHQNTRLKMQRTMLQTIHQNTQQTMPNEEVQTCSPQCR